MFTFMPLVMVLASSDFLIKNYVSLFFQMLHNNYGKEKKNYID